MNPAEPRARMAPMPESKHIESGPVSTGAVSHRPMFAVGAVLLGAFLANFDSRLFTIGLPDLKGALGLSFDEGAWLSTAATASQIMIAPAVAWLATAFGLRRVLGIPSLLYALVSLLIPLVRDFNLLLALNIVHGLLLGTFVPATLMPAQPADAFVAAGDRALCDPGRTIAEFRYIGGGFLR
jgi:DHA2 family multidrug resistance protein